MSWRPLEQFIDERTAALVALDINYARKRAPHLDTHTLLVGMHKARYECAAIDPLLRHESGEWLKERGYQRLYGLPWPE